MNNPLKQYFRRPAVYLKLPSDGIYYDKSDIDLPETGELPVYPMTAIDEITVKTPDALFNGNAMVDVIKSCVPNIINPWKLSNIDLDAVLLSIKAASGVENLEIESKCDKCEESTTYTIQLGSILETLKSPDYSKPLEYGDLKIKFRPMTYKDMNEANLSQFNIQRLFKSIEDIDPTERENKTVEVLLLITKATIEIIEKTIEYIESPSGIVNEREFILDFLNNCDNKTFVKIKEHHSLLKETTQLKPLDVKCPNCEHEYKQPYVINATDFFG